jgi:hypothetical protein
MADRDISLGRLFVQEAVKAGTWGFVFLLAVSIFIASIKQDIKEGIAFGVDRFLSDVALLADDPELISEAKRLIKRGIEYSATAASKEAKGILAEKTKAEAETKTPSRSGTQ